MHISVNGGGNTDPERTRFCAPDEGRIETCSMPKGAARQRSLEKYRLAEHLARMRDPVARRVSHRNAMAKRKQAAGVFTRKEWLSLLRSVGFRCRYCGRRLTRTSATPDHRTPLGRRGSNWITNIVPACLPCNQRKSNLTEKEYLRRLARTKFSTRMGAPMCL